MNTRLVWHLPCSPVGANHYTPSAVRLPSAHHTLFLQPSPQDAIRHKRLAKAGRCVMLPMKLWDDKGLLNER